MASAADVDSSYEELAAVAPPEEGDSGGGPREWRGPQIKLQKFSGFRSGYRGWRNEVQAILKPHSVPEDQQVLFVYLALEAGKGKPRDLYGQLSIDEIALLPVEDIWKKLSKEYFEEEYIEADEAFAVPDDIASRQSADGEGRSRQQAFRSLVCSSHASTVRFDSDRAATGTWHGRRCLGRGRHREGTADDVW